ncbi:hypothetical protein IW147_004753 [Coemansia sp. RSA 720]|nr:hypothetical protein IW147_004753 [Coemansia sp. RSA 720]
MLADSEAARSTLGLAHSLLQSRVSWLTRMFDALNTASCAQPRQLLGAVELQIGPHLFAHTQLFKITEASEDQLALQFAENTSDLFWVPGDLGIDTRSEYEGHGEPLHLYFYAQPHSAKRMFRAERMGAYCLADKRLARIQVVVRGADQKLGDALVQYTERPMVKVCREYRHAMCVQRPMVKYGWAFLPESQRPVLSLAQRPALSLAQRPVVRQTVPRVARVESSDDEVEPEPVLRPVYRGGGKTGYTAAVAATRLKRRKEYVSDSDSSGGNDVSVARKQLARK